MTKEIERLPDNFYITYYADKHKKIITRKGQWHKPETDTVGKYFVDTSIGSFSFDIKLMEKEINPKN